MRPLVPAVLPNINSCRGAVSRAPLEKFLIVKILRNFDLLILESFEEFLPLQLYIFAPSQIKEYYRQPQLGNALTYSSSSSSSLICLPFYEWIVSRRFEEGNACSFWLPVWLTPMKLCFLCIQPIGGGGAQKAMMTSCNRPQSRLALPFLHLEALCFNDCRGATEIFERSV